MICLIDGDAVAYRAAASCEPTKNKQERESLDEAIYRATDSLHRILNYLAPDEYRIFLGGTENFRKVLCSDYKSNRTKADPVYLGDVRSLLVGEWGAEVCAGYEGDDGIGIAAQGSFIIAAYDKDLRQIPGWHYDFTKSLLFEVDPESAVRNFYTQMLVGDSSDHVSGVPGIGTVRAGRILDNVLPSEMESVVHDCYRSFYGSSREYIQSSHLLYVLRHKEEYEEIEAIFRQGEGAQPTKARSLSHLVNISGANKE